MNSVSLASAAVALCGAAAAALLGYWQQRRLRQWEQRTSMDRYGGSLVWAAFDLQSRLFNILHGHAVDRDPARANGILTALLLRGTPEEAEFIRRSTVFVLAEYLGWVEILRRDVQFLDLGRSSLNTRIMLQISRVSGSLGRIDAASNDLRLFRAQQRAIGELMIHPDGEPGHRRCLGYAEFCAKLTHDPDFAVWFAPLLADLDHLAADTAPALPRLQDVQAQLIALIDLLDPHRTRFPRDRLAFQDTDEAGT